MNKILGILCIVIGLSSYGYAFTVESTGLGSSIGTQSVGDQAALGNTTAISHTFIGSIDVAEQWSIVFKPTMIWSGVRSGDDSYYGKLLVGFQYTQPLDQYRSNFVQVCPGFISGVTKGGNWDGTRNAFAGEMYSECWPSNFLNFNIDLNVMFGRETIKIKHIFPIDTYSAGDIDLVLRPLFLTTGTKIEPMFISIGPLGTYGCSINMTDKLWTMRYRAGAVIQFKTSLSGAVLVTMASIGYSGTVDGSNKRIHDAFANIEIDTAFW